MAMKSQTCPPKPYRFPLRPATHLLHPRSISVSDQCYWDSHLGYQSQGPIFPPPSLHPTAQLSSFPQLLVQVNVW